MSELILGLHRGHNASAALVIDGRVAYAIQEERINRVKRSDGFPRRAIREIFEQMGTDPGRIDKVAWVYNWLDTESEHVHYYLGPIFGKIPPVEWVKHHTAHAAGAYYPSGFEKSLIITLDGRGERDAPGGPAVTGGIYLGDGNRISTIARIMDEHFSFGAFYGSVSCEALRDPEHRYSNNSGIGMALAPFGSPTVMNRAGYTDESVLSMVKEFLVLSDREPHIRATSPGYFFDSRERTRAQIVGRLNDLIRGHVTAELSDDERLKIMMHVAQSATETAILFLVNRFLDESGCRNLCLSGGVALNSVSNWRIKKETGVENLWIQPASSDAGLSAGAALQAYFGERLYERREREITDYHGRQFSSHEVREALLRRNMKFTASDNIAADTANLLQNNKIIGWFHGRDEFGPRALGNRSILANPCHPEMKNILNSRVKFREDFRPFAPVIIEEQIQKYFEIDCPSYFMLLIPKIREEYRAMLPAVSHIDDTARVQSVNREQNPKLHELLIQFERRSGVPILLNTSFNIKGEPIVHTPDDAINCFLKTGMDCLVMGDLLVAKT